MTVYNEESYTSYYTRILKELEDLECFCVSITTDNEVSPNAGIDAAIQNDSQSFASFHCGDHTIELMVSNLTNSFPLLQEAIDVSKSFVTAVRGTKSVWKALNDVQVAAGVKKTSQFFCTKMVIWLFNDLQTASATFIYSCY